MNNRSELDGTAQAAKLITETQSSSSSTPNSVYHRLKQRRLKYCKSPTTNTMVGSDSDSDQEYPHMWRDRLDYSDDGEFYNNYLIFYDLKNKFFISFKIVIL